MTEAEVRRLEAGAAGEGEELEQTLHLHGWMSYLAQEFWRTDWRYMKLARWGWRQQNYLQSSMERL